MLSSVIDIGSNSIKMLVAEGVNAVPVFAAHSDTRLSPNTDGARERIPEAAFAAGVEVIRGFAEKAREFSPVRSAIVGTSLLRTAENAREFADAVFRATGTPLRILSGIEEAKLIAAGVAGDPAVRLPCAIFDLGGGSLEFIAKPEAPDEIFEMSRPLGAVRMMRKFFADASGKIPATEISALRRHVRESVADALPGKIPPGANAVFCGGVAKLCAQLCGNALAEEISSESLEEILRKVCAQTLTERIAAGVPAKRADIFPAAVATLAEICRLCAFPRFRVSERNLRYGLCAELNAGAEF